MALPTPEAIPIVPAPGAKTSIPDAGIPAPSPKTPEEIPPVPAPGS